MSASSRGAGRGEDVESRPGPHPVACSFLPDVGQFLVDALLLQLTSPCISQVCNELDETAHVRVVITRTPEEPGRRHLGFEVAELPGKSLRDNYSGCITKPSRWVRKARDVSEWIVELIRVLSMRKPYYPSGIAAIQQREQGIDAQCWIPGFRSWSTCSVSSVETWSCAVGLLFGRRRRGG